MGAILLGTSTDPANPTFKNFDGAPSFNARLTAIKGFHRLCDGVRTVFMVDCQGELTRLIDIRRWADATQGPEPLEHPCPRAYVSHAKATRTGGHVCLVLTPAQEIKVFARGTMMFGFSDARWRLLDIPSKFAVWCEAVGCAAWSNSGASPLRRRLEPGRIPPGRSLSSSSATPKRRSTSSSPHPTSSPPKS